MARTGRGASGGPRGRRRSSPQRRRVWLRPCASSVKQVGSWRLARSASARRGASPKAVVESAAGTRAELVITESDGTMSPRVRSRLQSRGTAGRDARRLGGILGDDKSKVEERWGLGGGQRELDSLGMVSRCGDPGLLSAGVPA